MRSSSGAGRRPYAPPRVPPTKLSIAQNSRTRPTTIELTSPHGDGARKAPARPAPSGASPPRPARVIRQPCTAKMLILIAPAPPDVGLVAALRRAVEPLVHAPQRVEAAGVGRVRVVDDAVLERERAHAGPLARVGGHVGAGHRRHLRNAAVRADVVDPRGVVRGVVVLEAAAAALLLLGDRGVEVVVEVAVE